MAGGTEYAVTNMINGEWQEYTIDVSEDGEYDFVLSYSSNLNNGTARISLSFPDEEKIIVENYKLYSTFSWDSFWEETVASNVSLTKGKHVLRLEVVQLGFHLDWIKITGDETTSNNTLEISPITVFPNPNSTGKFYLNKESQFIVYSIEGMKIISGEGRFVDISAYPKGIYFLKTESSNHKIVFN